MTHLTGLHWIFHKLELAETPFRLVLHTELGRELLEGFLLLKLHVGLAWCSFSMPWPIVCW